LGGPIAQIGPRLRFIDHTQLDTYTHTIRHTHTQLDTHTIRHTHTHTPGRTTLND